MSKQLSSARLVAFAAAADAWACCQILIEKGANVEARDYRSRTPLFVAAELDRSVSAKFLIEQNADATAKGFSPVEVNISSGSVGGRFLSSFYTLLPKYRVFETFTDFVVSF